MSVNKTVWLLVALAALWCAFLPRLARADGLHLMELDEFSMDVAKIRDYRDGYFRYAPGDQESGETWDSSVAANFNLSLVRYGNWGLYVLNTVHGETTDHQYRRVGWQYEAGARLGSRFKVWWRHHSEHALDTERDDHFPLQNFYGASITFYSREKP